MALVTSGECRVYLFPTAGHLHSMASPKRQPKSSTSSAITPSRGLASLSLNSSKKTYVNNAPHSRPASPSKGQRTSRSPTKTPATHRRARSKSQTARDGGVGRDVVSKESTSRPGSPQKGLQRRRSNKVSDVVHVIIKNFGSNLVPDP